MNRKWIVFSIVAIFLPSMFLIIQNADWTDNLEFGSVLPKLINGSVAVAASIRNLNKPSPGKTTVTIGLVICGDKMPEALAFLSSLVLFSRDVHLDLRIFQSEIPLEKLLTRLKELQQLKANDHTMLSYKIYNTWFPSTEWQQLLPLCTSQRVFFPSLLPNVSKIIYMDADTLFFSNVFDLWSHFDRMNATQFAAMAPDGLPPAQGTYSGASFPFYGPRGLNAGVLLMDLARMRKADFVNELLVLLPRYQLELDHGEQDLLNIYFYFHPQFMYPLTCDNNYGHQHCECRLSIGTGDCACKIAENSGISVFHGCNQQFRSKDLNIFQQVFQIFSEYDLANGSLEGLLNKLKQTHKKYKELNSGKCSELNLTIFSKFEKYVQSRQ